MGLFEALSALVADVHRCPQLHQACISLNHSTAQHAACVAQ